MGICWLGRDEAEWGRGRKKGEFERRMGYKHICMGHEPESRISHELVDKSRNCMGLRFYGDGIADTPSCPAARLGAAHRE